MILHDSEPSTLLLSQVAAHQWALKLVHVRLKLRPAREGRWEYVYPLTLNRPRTRTLVDRGQVWEQLFELGLLNKCRKHLKALRNPYC